MSFTIFNPEGYIPLTPEESAELKELILKNPGNKSPIIKLLRNAALEKGISADILEDLNSPSGFPYIEIIPKIPNTQEDLEKLNVQKLYSYAATINGEMAYFCQQLGAKEIESKTCGWVKGTPVLVDNYDGTFHFVQDNATPCFADSLVNCDGTFHFVCYICGRIIGKI